MSALELTMRAADESPLLLEKVSVRGTVHATVARILMRQQYRNETGRNVEAVYTFPLPPSAVLLRTVVELGGKRYEGAVLAKAKAERKYEEAVAQGDTAIMVERPEPGLYTMNVGNLMAGESATVEVEFAQLLDWSNGRLRLALPMTIAPRYGEERSALQPQQKPEYDPLVERPFDLRLRVAAKASVHSPTHEISTRADGGELLVALTRQSAWMDRDFVIVVEGTASTMAMCNEGVAYASLQIPEAQLEVRGRDVRVVVDCSGSMEGESIALARKGAIDLLARLRPADRLGLIAFGTKGAMFRPRVLAASERHVEDAIAWVRGLEADMGGTELAAALEAAMAIGGGEGSADIFLVTDGQVGEATATVNRARKLGHRVFVVGIGLSPGAGMLEGIVAATGGAIDYVAPGEHVAEAIGRQFARLTQEPVSDVTVDWVGGVQWGTGISRAAYSGDTVHAFAGVSTAPTFVRVSYTVGGKRAVLEAPVSPAPAELADGTLARLAAEARIREGLRAKSLATEAATALAVEHQLVTELTNYVLAVDRAEARAPGLPQTLRVHSMLSGLKLAGTRNLMIGDIECLSLDEEIGAPNCEAAALSRKRNPLEPFLEHVGRRFDFMDEMPLPLTLDELRAMELPEALLELLHRLVDSGQGEEAVVKSFWVALARTLEPRAVHRGLLRQALTFEREGDAGLVQRIGAQLEVAKAI